MWTSSRSFQIRSGLQILLCLNIVALHQITLQLADAQNAENSALMQAFEGADASSALLAVRPSREASAHEAGQLETGLVERVSPVETEQVLPDQAATGADGSSATVGSEEKLLDGWEVFEDLSPEKEQLVKVSALSDRVLILPPQRREVFAERSLKNAWEGNLPQLSTGLERLLLRFRRDPHSSLPFDEKRDPEHFDLKIDFRGRLTVLTHSRLGRKSTRGVEFVASEREAERKFIAGQGASGMALLMPRVQLAGQNARALILCPRTKFKMDRRRGKDQEFFVETPYRLIRVIAKLQASVKGNALTAGSLGLARASIVTSKNVARAKGWRDESVAVDPRVALSYVPIGTEIIPGTEGDRSQVSAIEARLELQRLAGFKRESIERTLVWTKEFELGSNEPWFIGLGAKHGTSRVAPGVCYTLLVETQSEQKYTKEEFVVPQRLKTSGGEVPAVASMERGRTDSE